MRRLAAMVALVSLLLVGLAATTRAQDAGLPAVIDPIAPQVTLERHPTYDGSGNPLPDTEWRVVSGTGNSAENYLAATSDGRILDLGGKYLNYTDDLGETWSRVRPPVDFIGKLASHEGAVTAAPGGDILGLFWDPFSPDRAVSVKYDAATDAWLTSELVLKTPFFDRPWIAAIPGPFSVGDVEVPYISVIIGGWPLKLASYVSLDGLNYMMPSAAAVEAYSGRTARWLDVGPHPESDWIQPHTRSGITPLAGAGALAPRYGSYPFRETDDWVQLLPGQLGWKAYVFPDGSRPKLGRYLVDSRGRIHRVDIRGGSMTYEISTDGARSWSTTDVELPPGHTAEERWDFKANGELGITAVAVHAQRAGTDIDLVYRFSNGSGRPVLERIYELGAGDLDTLDALVAGSGRQRFDFSNIVILPDGRLATSFVDSTHEPSLAIEMPASSPSPEPTDSSPPPSPTPTPTEPDPTPTSTEPDPCPTETPPEPSPTPTEPGPTPTPTDNEPGTSTRYFFHSQSGAHLVDDFVGGATFDDLEPSRDAPAFVTDPLGRLHTGDRTYLERAWTGQIAQPFDQLTIDFWADGSDPPGHMGTKNYGVWLRTDEGTFDLGSFSREEVTPADPDRIRHTFDTYFDADGNELPLRIDDTSGPISVGIAQPSLGDGIILYDSKTYPSGFTVSSGNAPAENEAGSEQGSAGAQVSLETGQCGSVAPEETTVRFTARSAGAAQYTDSALLEARLSDSAGNPISNAQLGFELTGADGSDAWTATTDESGVASRRIAANRVPGSYLLTVSYGGDERRARTADSAPFVIEREDTELSLTSQGRGSKRLLVAELKEPDGGAVAGREISFYAGDRLIGTATTNDLGMAVFDPPSRYQSGSRRYEAHFDGDPFFVGSAAGDST